jgi:xanthine/uracil permease
MIGILGAKIWIENKVDFGNPVNLVPIAAAIILGVGNVSLKFTKDFSITGIAAGTLVAVIGWHLCNMLAKKVKR